MKKLILSIILLISVNSFANPAVGIPTDFPTDSNWSVYMTEKACKLRFVEDVTGASQKTEDGVLYSVFNAKGQILLQAKATSYSRFAKATCWSTH